MLSNTLNLWGNLKNYLKRQHILKTYCLIDNIINIKMQAINRKKVSWLITLQHIKNIK